VSDAEIRAARRAALADHSELPAYVRALARAESLFAATGQTASLMVELELGSGLRRHPWSAQRKKHTRAGKLLQKGKWWAPFRGHQEAPGEACFGKPGAIYLAPCTDRGVVICAPQRLIKFRTVDDLADYLADVHDWREPPVTHVKERVA
jgi:hypothetical protein